MPTSHLNSWSVAKHDVVPSVDFNLSPLEAHVYLLAFLKSEGEEFAPPYSAVRGEIGETIRDLRRHRDRAGQAPSADVSDQRLRTWRSVFESLGFLFVDPTNTQLRLTPLGRTVIGLFDDLNRKIAGANDHMAKLGIAVLNRHVLRNPLEESPYPEDSDIHPYRLIWRAMRQLDDKLHWEELNRVIMKVFSETGRSSQHRANTRSSKTLGS